MDFVVKINILSIREKVVKLLFGFRQGGDGSPQYSFMRLPWLATPFIP
jgi:hypothetical protein